MSFLFGSLFSPTLFSVNETLDDMLEDSDDEEETNGIVNQVLDEIGIEISGKVCYTLVSHKFMCLPFIILLEITP